jgi:hypothetical protein
MVRQVLHQAEGDRRLPRRGRLSDILRQPFRLGNQQIERSKPFDTIRLAFEGWLLRLIGLM